MRRTLGCWGKISSAGSRTGEGGPRGTAPRGDADLGGGAAVRRPGARPCLEDSEGLGREEVTPHPASGGSGERAANGKSKPWPSPSPVCQVRSGSLWKSL